MKSDGDRWNRGKSPGTEHLPTEIQVGIDVSDSPGFLK